MDLIGVLVLLLVLVCIGYVAFWVIGQMAPPDPINMLLRCAVGLVLLLVLLGAFTGHITIPSMRLR